MLDSDHWPGRGVRAWPGVRPPGPRGLAGLTPGQDVEVEVTRPDGSQFAFTAKCRIDTANEMEYYRNGGILHYVLRKLAA